MLLQAAGVYSLFAIALVCAAGALLWFSKGRVFARGQESRSAEISALVAEKHMLEKRGVEMQLQLQAMHAESAAQGRELAGQGVKLQETQNALDGYRRKEEEWQRTSAELAALKLHAMEQQVRFEAERQHLTSTLALLENAEPRLQQTFENLASRIFEIKSQNFKEQSSSQLNGLLEPLREQLKDFRQNISDVHAKEQRERGALAQEILQLKSLNQQISQDAINLTRALKGDNRAMGAWGELILERVLESCGLEKEREYTVQTAFSNDVGGYSRPDVVVHLPENKDIVIDAKVSLVAYDRYCSANEDEERRRAIGQHVESLRRHIQNLTGKNYAQLDRIRTLDFVVLFIPIEAAFIEAIRADEGIYQYALRNQIVLASPSTLYAILRTVAHLWRVEKRNLNAEEIAKQAGQIHDGLVALLGEFEAIGAQIDKAYRTWSDASKRISTGRGNLLQKAQKLKSLGATTHKSFPNQHLEKYLGETIDMADELESD